jgi:hypothetical protein
MDLNEDLQRVDERVRENDEMLGQSNGIIPEHMSGSQTEDTGPSSIGIQSSSTNMSGFNLGGRNMGQNLANQLLSSGTPIMTQSLVNNLKRLPTVEMTPEVPRKKSRNYLDSHKNIEKKRRDRINQCLGIMKTLVPDCRQYGNKKLDKAEILEMSIDYIQRVQQQSLGKTSGGNMDLLVAQREWANELTAWVIQNKLLYSGANGLDQFINSLLLHLQSFGSTQLSQSAQSPTGANSLQQVSTGSEDGSVDPVYRQILLQQLQTSMSGQGAQTQQILRSAASIKTPTITDSSQQQNQIQQHLQAIMMLQQQQQQLVQQCEGSTPDPQVQQQMQQLQNLQLLIAQHLTSDGMSQKLNVHQLATLLQLLQQHQAPAKGEDEADIPSRGVHTVSQEAPEMDPLSIPSLPSDVSRDVVSSVSKDDHTSMLMGLQEGYLADRTGQTPEEEGRDWRLAAAVHESKTDDVSKEAKTLETANVS